jgi:hypothetical protein
MYVECSIFQFYVNIHEYAEEFKLYKLSVKQDDSNTQNNLTAHNTIQHDYCNSIKFKNNPVAY